MDEFAIDPERGMCLEEMRALEKAVADGRAGNALVETSERVWLLLCRFKPENVICLLGLADR